MFTTLLLAKALSGKENARKIKSRASARFMRGKIPRGLLSATAARVRFVGDAACVPWEANSFPYRNLQKIDNQPAGGFAALSSGPGGRSSPRRFNNGSM